MEARGTSVAFVGTLFLLVTAGLELEERCETPNKLSGTCIGLRSCPPLVTVLQIKPISMTTLNLLRRSHCGFYGEKPLICCPSTLLTPAALRIPPIQLKITEDVSQNANFHLLSSEKCGPISGNKTSELGDSCETPDGDCGTCIRIRNCPPLLDVILAKPIPPATLDLLRRSRCGLMERKPLFCCPYTTPTTPSTTPSFSQLRQLPDTNVTEDVGQHANLRLLRPNICGPIADNRIINGNRAQLSELPWMALVLYRTKNQSRFGCGGTVISDRYILTAAHCVKLLPEDVYPISVRLGENDLESGLDCEEDPDGEPGDKVCAPAPQDIEIEEIIPHPSYTGKPKLYNDIALIRLLRPADFRSDFVRPICLPIGLPQQNYDLVGKKVTVSGWGVTENGKKSTVLLKVALPVVTYEQCTDDYRNIGHISAESQVCAGKDGRDSCIGDSGGPLHYFGEVDKSTRIMQHGIISFGPKECGSNEQPGVYTRVGHYMKWILDNMKE